MGLRTFNNGSGITGTDFDEELDYKGRQPNQIDSIISSSLNNEILFNSTVTLSSTPLNQTQITNDGGINQILFKGGNPVPQGLISGLGGRILLDAENLPLEINIDLGDNYLFNKIRSFHFIDTTYALSWVPKTMEIKVSNDGSTFTTVFEQTSNSFNYDSIQFSQNGTPLYKRYIKIIVTSIGSDYVLPGSSIDYSTYDTSRLSINELEIQYIPFLDTNSQGDYITEETFETDEITYELITEKHDTLNIQWNMVGFTYVEPIPTIPALFCYFYNTNNVSGLSVDEMRGAIQDFMSLIKDTTGLFTWPEFGYDGLGALIPGRGYQLRINDDVQSPTFFQGSNGKTYKFILSNPDRTWRVPVDNFQTAESSFQYPNTIEEQIDFVNINNTKGPNLNPEWNIVGYNRYTLTNDKFGTNSVSKYLYLLFLPLDNPGNTFSNLFNDLNYLVDGSYYHNQLSKPINERNLAFFNRILASIMSLIKDTTGLFTWPEFGYDGLGNLIPGQGYQMRINDDTNLEYFHNKLYNVVEDSEGNYTSINSSHPDYIPFTGLFQTRWPADDPQEFVGISLLADFPGIT